MYLFVKNKHVKVHFFFDLAATFIYTMKMCVITQNSKPLLRISLKLMNNWKMHIYSFFSWKVINTTQSSKDTLNHFPVLGRLSFFDNNLLPLSVDIYIYKLFSFEILNHSWRLYMIFNLVSCILYNSTCTRLKELHI